jgi:ACS family hexuronate transporter-like MFS transporter
MAGGLGGIMVSKSAGALFDHYKALGHIQTGYLIVFIFCGFSYLLAWMIMHFLVPRLKPVNL